MVSLENEAPELGLGGKEELKPEEASYIRKYISLPVRFHCGG